MDLNSGTPGQEGSGSDNQSQGNRSPENQSEDLSRIISERVNETRTSVTREFQGKLDALQAKLEETQQPKPYTRTELSALVTKGEMSESEAQSLFDQQQEKENEVRAERAAQRVINGAQKDADLNAAISKYTAFDPELLKEGTESRSRVADEIQFQMQLAGQSEATLATELNALRVLYGPEAALGVKPHDRQTHSDVQGSGGQEVETKVELSKRERDHYRKMVDMGQMTWGDVEKEMEYSTPDIRRRAAAR